MSCVDFIKAQGYRVFVRGENPTYCFFTDGKNIGYAQWEIFRQSVSTVHKPNKTTGTGFHVADKITAETLKAAFSHSPHWASTSDRQSVVKYADFAAYLNASKWNSGLTEV